MADEDRLPGVSLSQRARDRGADWVQGAANYVFGSARDEPRIRRAADGFSLLFATVLVAVSARADARPSKFLDNLTATVASLPTLVRSLLAAIFVVTALYAVALLLAALVRWRLAVVRDIVLATVGAVLLTLVVGHIVTGAWPALGSLGSIIGDREATYPIVRLAALSAVLLSAAPQLSRPYRRLGHMLVLGCAFASLALGLGTATDVIAAFGVGWAVAAFLHLVFGSPSGTPPMIRVQRALRQLGVETDELEPLPERQAGVAFHRARSADGRQFLVKVYGRDAISARWTTRLWRQLWHRGSSVRPMASRRELVEHEALAGLLAARAGVRVPDLVAVGVAYPNDALIAHEWVGRPVAECTAADLTDRHLASAWSSLTKAHAAGIAHGEVDPTTVHVHGDEMLFAEWSACATASIPEERSKDAASLMVTTAVAVGPARAVKEALANLGPSGLEDALTYVQPAAFDDQLRRAVKASDLDLDALRVSAAAATGTDPPELIELRRVSIGSVLMFVLVGIAMWSLITAITEVGFSNLIDYVASGDLFWLLVALVAAQTPQLAQAVAVQGSIPNRLAFVPLVNEQFAVGFLSLAAPGTAVQVATNTRFLQRQGSSVPTALTAGTLVAVARLVVQLALVLPLVLTDVVDLGVNLDITTSGLNTTVVWILVGLVVACGAIVALVPKYRSRVVDLWRIAGRGVREALGIFRSWRQVCELLGGSLVSELLLAITLGIVVHAYGGSLGLATLIVIQSGTAIVNGFVPIPGGIGVWELLLTTALVGAGVPQTDAIAIAIAHRLATFYLPPIWGWFSLRWLRRNDYL